MIVIFSNMIFDPSIRADLDAEMAAWLAATTHERTEPASTK